MLYSQHVCVDVAICPSENPHMANIELTFLRIVHTPSHLRPCFIRRISPLRYHTTVYSFAMLASIVQPRHKVSFTAFLNISQKNVVETHRQRVPRPFQSISRSPSLMPGNLLLLPPRLHQSTNGDDFTPPTHPRTHQILEFKRRKTKTRWTRRFP